MKTSKWVKLRILLVLMGFYILFFILFLRFMYLQLGETIIINTVFVIILVSITSLIFGHLFLQIIDKSYGIIKLFKNNIKYRGSGSTIVDLMMTRKIKKNTISYMLLFWAFLINIFVSRFYKYNFHISVSLFILFLVLAVMLNQRILEYRINKGFYGTNEYEAREILYFIFDNSKDSTITGGNASIRIFPSHESFFELYTGEMLDLLNGIRK